MAQKIPLVSIVFTRGEGPSKLCGKPRTFLSFAEADDHIRKEAQTAPDDGRTCDKCDFVVIFADNEPYTGRLELKREHASDGGILQAQIRRTLRFWSGRRPTHLTAEQYAGIMSQLEAQNPTIREDAKRALETWELA